MKRRMRLRGFTIFLLIAFGLALGLKLSVSTAEVQGESMMPTFKTGRRVLVTRAYWAVGPIRKHDILVVKDNNITGYMIKRVYALEGDEVPWMYAPEGHRLSDGPYRVPQGQVFLMGDNRGYSEDCRKIGSVSVEKVIGKVVTL